MAPAVHVHERGTRLGMCLVQQQCVSCVLTLQYVSVFRFLAWAGSFTRHAAWHTASVHHVLEMATEFLNAIRVRPCFLYQWVRPSVFVFFWGGEYVCPSYGPLKLLKSAKSGRKSVRPFIKRLRNPYLPKNVKKSLNYRRCNI